MSTEELRSKSPTLEKTTTIKRSSSPVSSSNKQPLTSTSPKTISNTRELQSRPELERSASSMPVTLSPATSRLTTLTRAGAQKVRKFYLHILLPVVVVILIGVMAWLYWTRLDPCENYYESVCPTSTQNLLTSLKKAEQHCQNTVIFNAKQSKSKEALFFSGVMNSCVTLCKSCRHYWLY